MSRSLSDSPSSGGPSHNGHSSSHLPPWERRDIPRVPYMGTSSPGLTYVEHFEVQPRPGQPWSDRSPMYSNLHRQRSYDDWASQQSISPIEPWRIGAGSPAAQPPSRIEAPYNPPLYIPKGPRTPFMNYQTSYSPMTPLSPPDSRSPLSVASPASSAPPAAARPAAALPGTMSSRELSQTRSRAQQCKAGSKHEKSELTSKFGSKFKSAFKHMFKRDPVDDSDFEHIGNRHWAEEDY